MRSEEQIRKMLEAHQNALAECPDGNTIIEDTIFTLLWVLGKRDGRFHASVDISKVTRVSTDG